MIARRGWLVGSVAVASAIAGGGWALWRERARQQAEDAAEQFWTARFETLAGPPLAASALRGRPLLVNFWAPWCAPCVREMPALDRFQQAHAAAGWRVLGLAIDRPEAVRDFLAKTPVAFPIALAGLEGAELGRRLGNENGGLPFTVVFDPLGRVRERHLGETDDALLADWASGA